MYVIFFIYVIDLMYVKYTLNFMLQRFDTFFYH